MSRIGKNPIAIPDKVDVKINGLEVTVKGPKGTLNETFADGVEIKMEDKNILVTPKSQSKFHRALHGTVAAKIKNMIKGVTEGFEKVLNINGVGYRAVLNGKVLNLSLGFSHPVDVELPEGIEVAVEDRGMTIRVKGIDKQKVGQFAADIRKLRKPEPYKGKGIKYADEHIMRKAGKRAV
jgi:large subunit ribosomal protein L6